VLGRQLQNETFTQMYYKLKLTGARLLTLKCLFLLRCETDLSKKGLQIILNIGLM